MSVNLHPPFPRRGGTRSSSPRVAAVACWCAQITFQKTYPLKLVVPSIYFFAHHHLFTMFRVCQVVGRGASRSRWLVGLLTPGAAVTPNTAPALRRGFAGGLSEHGTSMKWQSVAVGAAAIAVAYEGARLWEPKTAHAEAPKQRNTATPPVTTSPPPPATPTTEPKYDEKPPSTETKPPEKKTQVPAVAKSEPELFFAQLLSQVRAFPTHHTPPP